MIQFFHKQEQIHFRYGSYATENPFRIGYLARQTKHVIDYNCFIVASHRHLAIKTLFHLSVADTGYQLGTLLNTAQTLAITQMKQIPAGKSTWYN